MIFFFGGMNSNMSKTWGIKMLGFGVSCNSMVNAAEVLL